MKKYGTYCAFPFTLFYLFAQNNLGPRLTGYGQTNAAVVDVCRYRQTGSGITDLENPLFL